MKVHCYFISLIIQWLKSLKLAYITLHYTPKPSQRHVFSQISQANFVLKYLFYYCWLQRYVLIDNWTVQKISKKKKEEKSILSSIIVCGLLKLLNLEFQHLICFRRGQVNTKTMKKNALYFHHPILKKLVLFKIYLQMFQLVISVEPWLLYLL